MTRKNLQHLEIKSDTAKEETKVSTFLTDENIEIKSTYSRKDIEGLFHLDFVAGIAPNLRGSYSTMYVRKPWTIQQYAGFFTAKATNAYYKKQLKAGQQALSVAFNKATQQGYNSDHDRAVSAIGKDGVAIDSVEDMKILFNQIPLEKTSVSMTTNGAILPILACYIVAAEEQGVKPEQLKGVIQNDILKELMVTNTSKYPLETGMKIISDILVYTSKYMPKFNSISISGYHLQEAGATADIELAYALANGIEYVRTGLAAGLNIDNFTPQISFYWGTGMNHFMEIAKMRAARMLWAKLIKRFNPKKESTLALKTHCQISSFNFSKQEPFKNITRTTIKAAAAAFGGTESLNTCTLNETTNLPSHFSTRIARNTQFFLQEETAITKTIDPWAGSYYVEKLTQDIAKNAWDLIEEIETLGGVKKAIKAGIPQNKIKSSALKKRVRVDFEESTNNSIVKTELEHENPMPSLKLNSEALKNTQIKQLKTLKAERNTQKVQASLLKLTEAAKYKHNEAPQLENSETKEDLNLLALAIEATRNRATIGEISNALEVAFGRHKSMK